MHAGAPVKFLGCSAVRFETAARRKCGTLWPPRRPDDDGGHLACTGIRAGTLTAVRADARVFATRLPPGCRRSTPDNAAVTRIFKRSVGGRMRHIRVNISFTLGIDARAARNSRLPSPCVRWWSMYST